MYLSDRDLGWAIHCGRLIVEPKPDKIDSTSIDLHLDSVDQAKIWNIDAFRDSGEIEGHEPLELRIGRFNYRRFSAKYLRSPPADPGKLVFRPQTERFPAVSAFAHEKRPS